MRVSSSRHVYVVHKIHDPKSGHFVRFTHPNASDSVNFAQLSKLLESAPLLSRQPNNDTHQHLPSGVTGQGGEDFAHDAGLERPSKRAKIDKESQGTSFVDSVVKSIPVALHTLDIEFDTTDEDAPFQTDAFEKGSRSFDEILRRRRASHRADETLTFDAGRIRCNKNSFHANEDLDDVDNGGKGTFLFGLPSDGILRLDSSSYDLRYTDMQNLIKAAWRLQHSGRAQIDCFLHIIVGPHYEAEFLPIILRVSVSVSLVTPKVFEPLPIGQRETMEAEAQRRLLLYLFGPSPVPEDYSGSTDMHFFLSALQAAPDLPNAASGSTIQHPDLQPTLLPFQQRSIAWLLSREHKSISESGEVISASAHAELPLFWDECDLPGIGKVYCNRLTGNLLPSFPPLDDFTGAILAEEPGLGKTLECITLVLLNPAPDRDPSENYWDPEAKVNVGKIKTTLIVTPYSLAQQWVDEFARHAPTLKVLVYEGYSKVPRAVRRAEADWQREREIEEIVAYETALRKRRFGEDDVVPRYFSHTSSQTNSVSEWCSYINSFDVCITTYNTLRTDLAVAHPPIVRPRREVGNYLDREHVRTPLIQCEWLRVIMDEVQMSGGDRLEEMVSLIPRLSSLAVSGTPARATVDDLKHVLSFLRVYAPIQSNRIWKRLKLPGFASEFKRLFERIGVRTIKAKVQHELTIPEQKRYIVPIELGRVERHVYDQNVEQALLELGMDSRGIASSEDWQLNIHLLRSWIRRLRGICTHPQVGHLTRQNDRVLSKPGAIKTIAEVLENMKNENWSQLMTDRRAKIVNEVRIARLIQHDQNDDQRYHNALDHLLKAREDMDALHNDLKTVLNEIREKRRALKEEMAKKRALRSASVSHNGNEDVPMDEPPPSTGKGKQRAIESEDRDTENGNDMLEDDLQNNPADAELKARHGAVSSRIRECIVNLHQIHFLLGDVYHALGSTYSRQEDEAYENAEKIRRIFLQSSERAAIDSSEALKSSVFESQNHEKSLIISHCGEGGKRSEDLLVEANTIIDLLNAQAELLLAWRKRIFTLLTQSLTSNDQADGEEYGRSLEVQGEAETYIQACMALFADRREALILERTALAAFDARERKIRHTVAAQRAAAGLENIDPNLRQELEPEQEVLKSELTAERKMLLKKFNSKGRAVKSIMLDLSNIANEFADNRNNPERLSAIQWSSHLRELISEQSQLHDRLEEDMALVRNTFNARVKYFAQLQELSDTVAEVTWEGEIVLAIRAAREEDAKLGLEINKSRARQRYLDNLLSDHADATFDDDRKLCILCKGDFVRGLLTQCAHVFCEDCSRAWFARREGKACPVCRMAINPDQLRRVTMREKQKDESMQTSSQTNNDPVPLSKHVIEYNKISPDLMEKIQDVKARDGYGSKIGTIVRHLLYLQENDPGAKSIIFSAWEDSLHILEYALENNGISSLRIDEKRNKKSAAKRFRTDPTILVLLLHGERDNAGLNITCASRVFLLESVVQHAFEIQAIARIDRLGQTRPTEVFCYYAEGTVEKNILDLAVRKGMSLYVKGKESGTLKMSTLELDEDTVVDAPAAGKKDKKLRKGDFIYKADDMLAILFPHMYEDVEEHLLEDYSEGNVVGDAEHLPRDDFIDLRAPVPGPSRIDQR